MQDTFLYISLPSLHDYGVKIPNLTFCGGRKQAITNFSFYFKIWVWSLGKFSYIWYFQQFGINATKFKKRQFILKVTFSLPSPSSLLKLPNAHVHPFTKITYCPHMRRKTVSIHRQASTAPKVCMSACRVEESQRFYSFLVYGLSYWVVKGKLLVERKRNLFDWPRISKAFTFRNVWATNIWWEFFCYLILFSWEAFLCDRITLF